MSLWNLSLISLLPVLLLGCHGTRPADLGVRGARLAPCPDSPNCVSSQADDEEHRIAPLTYSGDASDAMTELEAIIRSFPRAAVVTRSGNYLHAEFTSALFRFVDDVEFVADDGAKVVHVRSASRLGRSDLGVNRKRIEKVRRLWSGQPR